MATGNENNTDSAAASAIAKEVIGHCRGQLWQLMKLLVRKLLAGWSNDQLTTDVASLMHSVRTPE
jgi:hypothetical protein